jgi:ankyrin repeat protein
MDSLINSLDKDIFNEFSKTNINKLRINELIKKDANINYILKEENLMMYYIRNNHSNIDFDVINLLIEHRININYVLPESFELVPANFDFGLNRGGFNCLVCACLSGNIELIKLLVSKGANIYCKGENGEILPDWFISHEEDLFLVRFTSSENIVAVSGYLEEYSIKYK